jgi:hypothetical protein
MPCHFKGIVKELGCYQECRWNVPIFVEITRMARLNKMGPNRGWASELAAEAMAGRVTSSSTLPSREKGACETTCRFMMVLLP